MYRQDPPSSTVSSVGSAVTFGASAGFGVGVGVGFFDGSGVGVGVGVGVAVGVGVGFLVGVGVGVGVGVAVGAASFVGSGVVSFVGSTVTVFEEDVCAVSLPVLQPQAAMAETTARIQSSIIVFLIMRSSFNQNNVWVK